MLFTDFCEHKLGLWQKRATPDADKKKSNEIMCMRVQCDFMFGIECFAVFVFSTSQLCIWLIVFYSPNICILHWHRWSTQPYFPAIFKCIYVLIYCIRTHISNTFHINVCGKLFNAKFFIYYELNEMLDIPLITKRKKHGIKFHSLVFHTVFGHNFNSISNAERIFFFSSEKIQ